MGGRLRGLRRPASRRNVPNVWKPLGRFLGWKGWQGVVSLLTSVAAVGALFFSSQSIQAALNQVNVSEQTQITDRFGKAVDELGSDKQEVRIGGVYALERLAKDSTRDEATIIDVLSAFIRERAPVSSCPSFAQAEVSFPATDVQAALTVIGRRDVEGVNAGTVDLSKTCLAGATLVGAQLQGVDLTKANLNAVDLDRANLSGAKFDRTSLYGASLINANLTRAVVFSTVLQEAGLTGCNLTLAHFWSVNFVDAVLARTNFSGAQIEGSKFDHSSISDAPFENARLTDDTFAGARISSVDFTNAHMLNVDLTRAILDKVKGYH
ncbi:hypothetical protein GCM10018954_066130 [Kutzneria kofuensis]